MGAIVNEKRDRLLSGRPAVWGKAKEDNQLPVLVD